ncbi:MAG TPA: hypothetical protein VJ345_02485 [Anaerolineales bacterium]|nr:hypothetical protein [Anaerolineales bacterium]
MDLGQTIVVYLGIFLILWYAVALIYNRRLGIRTYRWLQPGVATLGKITQAKWLGSSGSGARIGVAQAKVPFRQAEVAFLLETRELLPLWLLNRLRGIRDSLVVRAQLRSVPQGELEILPQGHSRFGDLLTESKQNPWAMLDRELPAGLQAAARGRNTDNMLESAKALLNEVGPGIRRLSLARTAPHLILDMKIAQLRSEPSERFFNLLTKAFGGNLESADS